MLKSVIVELYSLLSPAQKKGFFKMQVLVVIMTFTEIMGVASIGPFMALIGDMEILEQQNYLADVYRLSGLQDPYDFLFYVGMTVLVALSIATWFSMYTTWKLSLFATQTGVEIGDRLYKYYMFKPWLFHAASSSAQLTKQVTTEAPRVTSHIVNPLMQMNAKLVLVFFMSLVVFLLNPMVSIIGVLLFSGSYFILYKLVHRHLAKNGVVLSETSTQRFQLLSEGFGGIKDVLLLGRQKIFVDRFCTAGDKLAYSQGANQALAAVPRYLVELVAFASFILLVLYLIKSHQGNLADVLPLVAIYALAGFKMLPAFQQIYGSVASIKGGAPAFEAIKEELKNSQHQSLDGAHSSADDPIRFERQLSLDNVSFAYPGKRELVLDQLSMKIPKQGVIGIVGPSGAGKSTIIDMLLGLIAPDQGSLMVDDQPIGPEKLRQWQNKLGYVPQSIFLSDATILENVAFGIPVEQIDGDRVEAAIKLAHLSELVGELPNGLMTNVGERGVQLSGGQRQRIGIARCLYYDPQVLVFDEATSALDGITEVLIMDAIHDFAGSKTIVLIAHRLKTVAKCDQIYFVEKGKVTDVGTYTELLAKNLKFNKMASHA